MTNNAKPLISIITPVYNEQENIQYYYDRITAVTDTLSDQYRFEFILTDNRSTDNTFKLLEAIAANDSRVRVFRLSRNYGYQKSIWTGYCQARGDAAIEFDCDLQDPPELLPQFLAKWQEGYKIVYGIRDKRQEKFRHTKQMVDFPFMRTLFYKLINKISEVELPANAGDFILIDQRVLHIIQNIQDHNIYLRGTIFSLGFSKTGVKYERELRRYGNTKFHFLLSLKLAMDGIISQSVVPLKFASLVGLMVAFLTMLLSFSYLFTKLFLDIELPDGFTTTIVIILFGISINALFLGVIGEYIARIYDQQKNRPITIIDQALNADDPHDKPSAS